MLTLTRNSIAAALMLSVGLWPALSQAEAVTITGCAQAGVDEYVTKPLRPRQLFQAIQSSLDARLQSRVS